MNHILASLKNFVESSSQSENENHNNNLPSFSQEEKIQFIQSEQQESQRLKKALETKRTENLRKSVLSSSSATNTSNNNNKNTVIIPRLLLRPKPDSESAMLMPAVNRVARALEAQHLLRCVVQWEHVCTPLWRALASEASVENSNRPTAPILGISPEEGGYQLSYAGYSRISGEIDQLREEALRHLMPVNANSDKRKLRIIKAMRKLKKMRDNNNKNKNEKEKEDNDNNEDDDDDDENNYDNDEFEDDEEEDTTMISFLDTGIEPSDEAVDQIESEILLLYSDFLPKVDATLFLSCPRQAKTGTVDIRTLYENLQVQIAVAKFAAEMLLTPDDGMAMMNNTNNNTNIGDRSVSYESLENYIEETLQGIPGCEALLSRHLGEAHKTVQVERFIWMLDRRNTGKLNLKQMLALPDLKDMLIHQLKQEELCNHPSESVRYFSCFTTSLMFEEFSNLDMRHKKLLSLGDMRKYRKFLNADNTAGGPSPLAPEVSPISFSFIKRYFEVTPTFQNELDFRCFVHFVLNVELLPGRCPRPHLFFDIFDTDGSGIITPTRMARFMTETRAKLAQDFESYGATAERQVDDLFHLIKTEKAYEITRKEFVSSVNVGLFCALAIDVLALMKYEQRDWTNPRVKQDELMQRPFSGRR